MISIADVIITQLKHKAHGNYLYEQVPLKMQDYFRSCTCWPVNKEGYCLMRESTSASSGPSWFSPPSSSSTNLFSSYSSTSTLRKRSDTVFFDMMKAIYSPSDAQLNARFCMNGILTVLYATPAWRLLQPTVWQSVVDSITSA